MLRFATSSKRALLQHATKIAAISTNLSPQIESAVVSGTIINHAYTTLAQYEDADQESSSYQQPHRTHPSRQKFQLIIPDKWRKGRRRNGHILQQMIELADALGNGPIAASQFFEDHVKAALSVASDRGGGVPYYMQPPIDAWRLNFNCMLAAGAPARAMLELARTMVGDFDVVPQAVAYVAILRRASMQRDISVVKGALADMTRHGIDPTFPALGYALEAAIKVYDTAFAAELLGKLKDVDMSARQMEIYRGLLFSSCRLFARYGKDSEVSRLLKAAQHFETGTYLSILKDVTHWAATDGRREVLRDSISGLLDLHHDIDSGSNSTSIGVTTEGAPAIDDHHDANKTNEDGDDYFESTDGDTNRHQQQQQELLPSSLQLSERMMCMVLRVAAEHNDLVLASSAWQLMLHHLIPDLEPIQHHNTRNTPPANTTNTNTTGTTTTTTLETTTNDAESESDSDSDDTDDEAADNNNSQQQQHQRQEQEEEVKEADVMGPSGNLMPSVLSFKTYLSTIAASGRVLDILETLLLFVDTHTDAVATTVNAKRMPFVVDALSIDAQMLDNAYYQLERWQKGGRPVDIALFNLVIAGCCQIGDLTRAFQTYEQLEGLGLDATVATFNVLLGGCVASNNTAAFDAVLSAMADAGVEHDGQSLHVLVDKEIVAGNTEGMLKALAALDDAGVWPEGWLLERCVACCERDGSVEHLEPLLHRLKRAAGSWGWKIMTKASKNRDERWRRYSVEDGAALITGKSTFVSRNTIKMQPYRVKKDA